MVNPPCASHGLPLVTVCGAYVSEDPANARLVTALHWVLRQVASFCLPGTRLTLHGAAEALDAAGLCVDVVWALEVRHFGGGCPAAVHTALHAWQHGTPAAVWNDTSARAALYLPSCE